MIKKKQIVTIISLALVASMVLSAIQNLNITSVNAQDDYGNVLQYEWPQSTGEDPGNTHFSSGPAPSTTNILWKFTETGGSLLSTLSLERSYIKLQLLGLYISSLIL